MKRLVNIPEYWQLPPRQRPRTFAGLIRLLKRMQKDVSGTWERTLTDAHTGEVLEVVWSKNVVTDNGALNMLKNMYAASGGAVSPYSIMAIASDAGSCKTSASIAAGSITSVPVTGLAATITNGSQIIIGYGTANATTATLSATASSGASSISVSSVTIPSGGIASGADVVPIPVSTDNPSSVSGAAYLSLVSGDYVYSAGTGTGNRTATITKKFPGASTTAGTYTSARMTNVNPIASGSVGATLYLPQATINSSTDQTYVFVIKI